MPNTVIIIIGIVLLILNILVGVYYTKIKGIIGEKKTATALAFLDKTKYKVLHNIVLQSGDETAQIDHLVIADAGIFVIETKNYKGWIVGNENAVYWTQVLFKRKEKLYNPLRQNQSHIKALKKVLVDYPNLEYISIVVFSSNATIKVNTNAHVVYTKQLNNTIKKHTSINLTELEKETLYHKIKALNIAKTYNKKQHNNTIKEKIKKHEEASLLEKCPRCQNNLVVREGKYGKFLA